jgi:hypothetical protein
VSDTIHTLQNKELEEGMLYQGGDKRKEGASRENDSDDGKYILYKKTRSWKKE